MAVEVTTNSKPFYKGKVPETYLYEDEHCVAFDEEIENIQAPIHFLVLPKKVIPRLSEASIDDEKLLGHLLIVARRVAIDRGLGDTGFRVVMNEGSHSCQKIQQFYVQVLGGRQMGHLLLVVKQIAIRRGLHKQGYHVVVNENYRSGTLHSLHVFGRALHHMLWPVGPGARL